MQEKVGILGCDAGEEQVDQKDGETSGGVAIDVSGEYTATACLIDGWTIDNRGTWKEMADWAEEMLRMPGVTGINIVRDGKC